MRLFHGTYLIFISLHKFDLKKKYSDLLNLHLYNARIESSMLLLAYVIYCVALYYNLYLEAWANTWNLPFPPRNHGQVSQ